MNQKIDLYLVDGCGRCAYYATPQCKVNNWQEELKQLRRILLECGLTEELKWSQPCYTYKGHNVVLMSAFKEYAALGFFKGTLLRDSEVILAKPGENSQAVRQFQFTRVEDVLAKEPIIKAYVYEAIELENAGLKVSFAKNPEPIPEELRAKLDVDPDLKKAFESLTPGRQRGYILHFSAPTQSKTRESRIEKCIPKILKGKGFHDR